jgi:hypothetical protein
MLRHVQGLQGSGYVSKMDAFEAFVSRIKYPALGVTSSAATTQPAASQPPAGLLLLCLGRCSVAIKAAEAVYYQLHYQYHVHHPCMHTCACLPFLRPSPSPGGP